MTMTATRFLAQYKNLKAHVEGLSSSPQLAAAFHKLVEGLKATYSTDSLKEALAADAVIPSELEERLTSALVLYNHERTLGASHVETPPEGSGES